MNRGSWNGRDARCRRLYGRHKNSAGQQVEYTIITPRVHPIITHKAFFVRRYLEVYGYRDVNECHLNLCQGGKWLVVSCKRVRVCVAANANANANRNRQNATGEAGREGSLLFNG